MDQHAHVLALGKKVLDNEASQQTNCPRKILWLTSSSCSGHDGDGTHTNGTHSEEAEKSFG